MVLTQLIKTLEYIRDTYGDGKVVLSFDKFGGLGPNSVEVEQSELVYTSSVGQQDGSFETHIQNFPY